MDNRGIDLKRTIDNMIIWCRDCHQPIRLGVIHQHGEDIMATTVEFICSSCGKSRWFKIRKYDPEKRKYKMVRMETS